MTWTPWTRDANGFTRFVPSEAASSPSGKTTEIVYVSSSAGSNSNNGLSVGAPKRTLGDEYIITPTGGPWSIALGAEYTNNLHTFIVQEWNGTTLRLTGTDVPSSGAGTLTFNRGPTSATGITFTGYTLETGAMAVLASRTGSSQGYPHWLLLKKGDTFFGSFERGYQDAFNGQFFSGPTAAVAGNEEPLLVSSYDPAFPTVHNPTTGGARPIVVAPTNAFVIQGGFTTHGGDNIAVIGLKLTNSVQDPTYTNPVQEQFEAGGDGIQPGCARHYFLIEDCDISHFSTGIAPGGNGAFYAGQGFDGHDYIRKNVVHRNLAQGIEGSQSGYSSGTHNGIVLEDNVINGNGYWFYYRNRHASLTAGTPGTVTWTNYFPNRTDRATTVQVFATANGLVSGTTYYVYNNNGLTFNLSSSPSSNVPVTISSNASNVDIYSPTYRAPLGLNHNIYYGTVSRSDQDSGSGYTVMRRNIISQDSAGTQFRTFGDFDNNTILYGPVCSNMGTQIVGQVGNLMNNVVLDLETPPGVGAQGFDTGAGGDGTGPAYGHATDFNVGVVNYNNNIFAHGINNGGEVFTPASHGHATAQNNIMYKYTNANSRHLFWLSATGKGGICSRSGPSLGVVPSANLTSGGSGYTPLTSAITGFRRGGMRQGFNGATSGNVIFTVASPSIFLTAGDAGCYITGLTGGSGGFDAAINGKVWKIAVPSTDEVASNEIMLIASDSNIVPGSYGSSGTVYAAYDSIPIVYVSPGAGKDGQTLNSA